MTTNRSSKRQSNSVSTIPNVAPVQPSFTTEEIQQKYVHLQTLLMLTQLNSAYYELHLSLDKVASRLENKYYHLKLQAFLTLTLHRRNIYESRNSIVQELTPLVSSLQENSEDELEIEKALETEHQSKLIYVLPPCIGFSQQMAKEKTLLKLKMVFLKVFKILSNKKANILSFSLHQMERTSNQTSNIKIYSEKSSKIETNDSQKSKIFRRSNQKKSNRKSFSVQKTGGQQKHEYYVPIKYQPQSKIPSPGLINRIETNEQSWIRENSNINAACYVNKFSTNIVEVPNKQRRNTIMNNRERKGLKANSSKKIHVSLMANEKEEKIKQLEYLKRKYKKLIAEFNWFSERFLKVIEEEEYVK